VLIAENYPISYTTKIKNPRIPQQTGCPPSDRSEGLRARHPRIGMTYCDKVGTKADPTLTVKFHKRCQGSGLMLYDFRFWIADFRFMVSLRSVSFVNIRVPSYRPKVLNVKIRITLNRKYRMRNLMIDIRSTLNREPGTGNPILDPFHSN